MRKNIALVPAAGRGLRMYPLTEKKIKVMVEIGGKPLLYYNLEILRDKLNVKEVYIVIGEKGEQVKTYFGDGSDLDLDITYIVQHELRGIGHAVGLGEEYIDRPFFVILGDEMYINTNHQEMLSLFEKDFNALCAFKRTEDSEMIKRNYTGEIEGEKILSLTEKPRSPVADLLGVGTYAFDPLIFSYIKKAVPSPLRNEIEITDVIDTLARKESKVYAFFLEGYYTNINTVKDLNSATHQFHSAHFDTYRISIVIPAYNEEASIASVIRDFQKMGSEVVVVDNNSTDRTAQVARECGAKVVTEAAQGYGNALRRGMDSAAHDILVVTEADCSFRAEDLPRMLEYLRNADMVIGTRTDKEMIEKGARMDLVLRWGNRSLGNLVGVLWGKKFTDVGCTYRVVWKEAYDRVKKTLKSEGPSFSVEMMIEMLKADMKVVEIPVKYCKRCGGESKYSSSRFKNVQTGLDMVSLIFKKRVE